MPQFQMRLTVALWQHDTLAIKRGLAVSPKYGIPKGQHELLLFFKPLRLPKAYAFPPFVILDEIDPRVFKRSAEGRFICQCDWDLPVNHFGSTDRGHAYLRCAG
jgi:hypothetical protein